MPTQATSRKRSLVIGGLMLVYLTGYLATRYSHFLIHYVTYATTSRGVVYSHDVAAGDFGPGILQSHSTRLVVPAAVIVFTPLRWAESLVWRLVPREY